MVQLPEWFDVLNRDFRYQLTSIGSPAPGLHVSSEIDRRAFRIAGGAANGKVSWQVTGIRQDKWANANRVQVERRKTCKGSRATISTRAFTESRKIKQSCRVQDRKELTRLE